MKKILLLSALVSLVFASCVTKQKYTECANDLKNCTSEKSKLTTENLDLKNKNIELAAAKAVLESQVAALRSDTANMGRLNRELSSSVGRLQKGYNELNTSYKNMSAGNQKEAEQMLLRLQQAQSDLDAKEKELKSLSDDLEAKTKALAEQQAKLTELQAILDKKDADVQALKNKIKQALKGFEGSGLAVTEKNGKVYVSMDEKLLFASGKFTIDARGEAALQELAKVLEADTTINVTVEGHTDNVPFSPATAAQIRDNWDLSVMRATTIVKTILKFGKDINPQRLTASGRGEYVPLDMTDTKEGRAKNRRTEIILTPNLDALFDI
ncbi:MAG: OmpA family protein, partial [Bacteroidales bacterium]|nr:OmpA family protein [Bacteroidales bacterium]